MSSIDDIRAAMEFLHETDPYSYANAITHLAGIHREINAIREKSTPAIQSAMARGDYNAARKIIDNCEKFHKLTVELHTTIINQPNLPDSDKDKTPPEEPPKIIQKTPTSAKKICALNGCYTEAAPGHEYCKTHLSYERRRKCMFPSCNEKAGYAGSAYCQFHYQEEMANSR